MEVDRPRAADAELPEYQSLSGLAVLALTLGVLSLGVLASPLLFIFPAAAVGCAGLALSNIRKSDGALTGRTFARWGIALALACTAAALVRGAVRDELLKRQAGAAAQQWLGLVAEGRLDAARDLLTSQAASSLVPQPAMGEPPLPRDQAETIAMNRLRADPLIVSLRGATSLPAVISVTRPVVDRSRTVVAAELSLAPRGETARRQIQMQLVRAREYEAGGRPWRIDHWDLVAEPIAGK